MTPERLRRVWPLVLFLAWGNPGGAALGLSIDTLRYYERIGLLPRIVRDSGGRRIYDDEDLARLRFIQRVKRMGFSLAEIAALLEFRSTPLAAKGEVRALTEHKLAEIESHLREVENLRDELRNLLARCQRETGCCPIVERLDRD